MRVHYLLSPFLLVFWQHPHSLFKLLQLEGMTTAKLIVLDCHRERSSFHFTSFPRLIFYFFYHFVLFVVCSFHNELVSLALVKFF